MRIGLQRKGTSMSISENYIDGNLYLYIYITDCNLAESHLRNLYKYGRADNQNEMVPHKQ